jgi:transcription antitermination factor NusG
VDFNGNDRRWCAVQVKPRHEASVSASLRSRGYEDFLPVYRSTRQWSDRRKEIEVPLFAGYVFCRLDLRISWPVVTTPGVIRIVGTRSEIAMIEEREIGAIRLLVNSGRNAQPCPYWGVGDRVRIATGSLAGVEGVVVAYKNQQRLVLSVDLIQSSISVEVDEGDLTLLRKTPAMSPAGVSLLPQRIVAADKREPAIAP